MKKALQLTAGILAAIGLFILPAGLVFSQAAITPGVAETGQVEPTVKVTPTPDISSPKARVRIAFTAWWLGYKNTSSKADGLVRKLEARITAAKAGGNDVKEAEALLLKAKENLAEVNTSLETLQKESQEAQTKNQFISIKNKYKTVRDGLQSVKKDAAKIISLLKGYNSATSESSKSATQSARKPTNTPKE